MEIEKIEKTVVKEVKGLTLLLYGKAGTSKSTFASKFPNSLLVDFEGTAGFVLGAKRFKPSSLLGGEGFYEVVKQFFESKYETLIIDGFNPFMKMFDEEIVLKKLGRKSIRDHKYADTYSERRDGITALFQKVFGRGKNIIIITHEAMEDITDTETDEVTTQKIPLIKDKELAQVIPAMVDNIGYTYTANIENEDGTRSNKFMIDFSPFGQNLGKNRFGIEKPIEAKYEELEKIIKEYLKTNNKK